ncbi:hypothetical protein KM043_000273 [Ampulex compressa]|nr:hypothetical protein KM043_000273 [Ampulex compressa]
MEPRRARGGPAEGPRSASPRSRPPVRTPRTRAAAPPGRTSAPIIGLLWSCACGARPALSGSASARPAAVRVRAALAFHLRPSGRLFSDGRPRWMSGRALGSGRSRRLRRTCGQSSGRPSYSLGREGGPRGPRPPGGPARARRTSARLGQSRPPESGVRRGVVLSGSERLSTSANRERSSRIASGAEGPDLVPIAERKPGVDVEPLARPETARARLANVRRSVSFSLWPRIPLGSALRGSRAPAVGPAKALLAIPSRRPSTFPSTTPPPSQGASLSDGVGK